MAEIEAEVFTEWSGRAADVGQLDVIVDEGTYLGSFFAHPRAMAKKLEEEGFFGLADYVRRMKGLVGYLSGMEVEVQGQGVGSALVNQMLIEFKKLGVKAVVLHRASGNRSSDEQLSDFYGKFGFEDVDCCQEDLWPVMKLSL